MGAEEDNLFFLFLVGDNRDVDEVEAAFEGGGEFVDAAVAAIGGGNDVEARLGENDVIGFEFGDGDVFFAEDGDEGVLDVGGAAGEFFEAAEGALLHTGHDGGGDEGVVGLASGDDESDIPSVFNLVFGGAGGALNDVGGVATDGGGEELGQPAFTGTGVTDEEEAAVGGEGDNGAFDDSGVTEPFLGDGLVEVIGGGRAEDEGADHGRGETPRERFRALVVVD